MTRITTANVTVNPAFFKEIKEVNQHLWELFADVRKLCQQSFPKREDYNALAHAFEELRDQLALHFALEEAYGYFDDPIKTAPRLCGRADQLRNEHKTLYSEVCALSEYAEQLLYSRQPSIGVAQLAIRFDAFFSEVLSHESEEQELILQAYDDDIGVGD